jgi:putative ABC transport system permease protein
VTDPLDRARSRLRIGDLASEAVAGLLQRPTRSLLTMLGTILGVGAFVAILGLTATAGSQIDKRFTALAATEVTVQDIGSPGGDAPDVSISFPADASARVQSLNGVVHAGVYWPVPLAQPVIAAAPVPPGALGADGVSVIAASPEALAAVDPTVQAGRLFNAVHVARAERVAVLGAVAANRLGISRLDGVPAVFINGSPYTVVGILGQVQRRPALLLSVILPTTTALQAYGPPTEQRAEMIVETRVGAAQLVASQAALALRPDQPGRFKVVAPPDPQTLRGGVGSDLNTLFLLLAAITLVIGAVGIANTTLVAVLERANEIGLRRALGARRSHIAGQFIVEAMTLGLFGGLIGSSLGVGIVVGTALIRDWSAVLAPWTVAASPALGALVGLLAGVYPALSATRIEPAEALRR